MADEQQQRRLFVVGIGASADGIEALDGLFRAVPADSGLAYVVVTHLPPGRESALAEIIGRFAPVPVSRAVDGEAVLADRVYVLPQDAILTLREGRLRLRRAEELAPRERNPIDAFLGSLAEDKGEQAIAVILSGAGSDGTLGVKAVKERGGFAIAQGADHSAPRHYGMPGSAIASGLVDLVLPAEEIAGKLLEYVRSFEPLAGVTDGDGGEPRVEICDILRKQVGHDFRGYKERTFLRRVQRRMQVLQLAGVGDYLRRLREDPDEVTSLFRDLLIGVTSFFRDEEAFAALEGLALPPLLEGKGAGDTVRVWVPDCSTGEEVYSIAILLRERIERSRSAPKLQLFATDIDDAALDVARAARYPAALVRGMSPDRLRRFFSTDGETYTLAKRVRDLCVFSSHSLIRDPPFSRVDLISCRNLLIYFSAELQSHVIPVFHYALRRRGFLFLGSAESVSQHGDLFAPVDKKSRVFQRRDQAESPVHFPMFVPGLRPLPAGPEARHEPGSAGLTVRRLVESRVLERFAPAHVVVNHDGEVVHYSSRTGKYLEPPAGQPSRQLLGMARRGLRLDLRGALQQAAETRQSVTRERVTVEADDRVQTVDLTVEPLPDHGADPLYLVLFADVGPPLRPDEAATARVSAAAREGEQTAERLERELRDARERLQAMIEEYETALEELKSANEELVSVNEELQSTNEELETSKEETQSVNEELHTVNQELGAKLDLLNQANSDLRNLFEGTKIAIVFLDQQLRVRSFTPTVTAMFNLLPGDRGRPLADITTHLDHEGLHGEIRAVVAGGRQVEARASRRDGKAHYLMRILPYKDVDGTADGAVITFFDITQIVEAERQQGTLVHELNHRVRNMLSVVMAIASQTLARAPSPETFADAFTGRIEALARAYGLVAREQWNDVSLEEVVREELEPHLNGEAGRIVVAGPPAQLRPRVAVALGMVVHELATNAAKYGALSGPGGRVEVRWDLRERDGAAAARDLVLRWEESGGPPVAAPSRKGFGTELIERQAEHELGGEAAIEFPPGGVRATIIAGEAGDVLG